MVEGERSGFRVGCTKELSRSSKKSLKNMPSALDRPKVIDDYLAEECRDPTVVPQVYSNRFGVIPKGANGKWRLIVDMSFLPVSSVNDGINEARSSLSYVQVQEASKGVMARGLGTLMSKVDVKSTYRNIPVQTEDRWLMRMTWRESVFVDQMQLSGSPEGREQSW